MARRVIGFYTDERGRKRPITSRRNIRPKGTIFFPPKYKKYADIVSLRTPEEAKGSVEILMKEFNNAETDEKKRRIKRVVVLAANRAMVARRKKDLSERERQEYREIEKIYRNAAEKMVI